MQRTATRSTSCRTNVETETLILSQVVHQVQEPACRPVGTPLAFRWQRDARKQLVEWNTRHESNLRALGSKPIEHDKVRSLADVKRRASSPGAHR